jgi:hypothetical protein
MLPKGGGRLALAGATAMLAFALGAPTALAMHPSESPHANEPEFQCNEANSQGYLVMPDGERWQCLYDEEAEEYFWEPRRPLMTEYDAVGWKNQYWTAPDGATFRVTTRNEWINWIYYGGSDVFFRDPVNKPLELEAGKVGFYQELWTWNGSAWSECKHTEGWTGASGPGVGMVDTLNYGNAACGAAWYDAITWIEVWNAATSTWDMSPQVDPVEGGHTEGNPQTGENGQVYDPGPDWNGVVPKPPSSAPPALPPIPTLLPPPLGQLGLLSAAPVALGR